MNSTSLPIVIILMEQYRIKSGIRWIRIPGIQFLTLDWHHHPALLSASVFALVQVLQLSDLPHMLLHLMIAHRPKWVPNSNMHLTASLIPRPSPFFVLRFAFSIIHGSGWAWKMGKAWSHLSREISGHSGGADIQICNELTPKVSFLRVKASSFDHANVLSPELQ